MIENIPALTDLLGKAASSEVCAVDTEADSLHRYRESLCLIQFAWPDGCELVDPLAIEDLTPMADFMASRTVWMHGADYDMTMLRREFGVLPKVVFDTQIGARLLGVRKFGLANLVEHYFDVTLSKTSQKADWGKRPLSDKMVDYALNDVRYLLPMGEKIVAALKERGRYDWFVESCEAAREKVLERDEIKEEPWRISGAGKLDGKGLNFLRGLWTWRDKEAENWDRPSFMVATNRQLLEWSLDLAKGGRVDCPHHFRPDRRRRFNEAIKTTAEISQENYPKRIRGTRRRRDPDFEKRVNELLEERDRKARELDIDGSLVAPRAVIEAIAADDGDGISQLLGWQRELLDLAEPECSAG